jgi:aspartate kinase
LQIAEHMGNSNTIVMKFGGTSVADAAAMLRVAAIVRGVAERTGAVPVVVVSAMSGVTDRLLALGSAAESGRDVEVATGIEQVWERHVDAARGVLPAEKLDGVLPQLTVHLDELRALLKATSILRSASSSALDGIAAAGELLSSRIVAAALDHAGMRASWVDARRALVTDDAHMAAVPLADDTRAAVQREIAPIARDGRVTVVGGFVGATRDGVTTTLGRGGSDYSASIIGAALGAREIQIWTDVDGMLTADPRVVGTPRVVSHLSFGEASELAYFGAKVLHPSTILPAVTNDIPVRILNSRRPEAAGTLITGREAVHDRPVTALACKRGVTVVDITSTRMLMAHGFLRRLFEVFERFRTAVDVVTTSEVSVSVTVDDDSRVEAIAEALREFAEVRIERDMAILCAVGDSLRTDPHIASRVLGAIDAFPFRMVSQAASRRNVTIVLSDAALPGAMARLHEHFFGGAGETRLAAVAEQI